MAPYIAPWSVMARAGIPSSAARATMALIRLAPSSSENSVWLWRWTNVSGACGIGVDGWRGFPILDVPRGSGLVDPQNRLASYPAVAQSLDGSAKVAPADVEADLRSQLSLVHQPGQEIEILPEGLNVGRVDEEALDPGARTAAKVDEPDPRRLTAGGTIERDPSAGRQRID